MELLRHDIDSLELRGVMDEGNSTTPQSLSSGVSSELELTPFPSRVPAIWITGDRRDATPEKTNLDDSAATQAPRHGCLTGGSATASLDSFSASFPSTHSHYSIFSSPRRYLFSVESPKVTFDEPVSNDTNRLLAVDQSKFPATQERSSITAAEISSSTSKPSSLTIREKSSPATMDGDFFIETCSPHGTSQPQQMPPRLQDINMIDLNFHANEDFTDFRPLDSGSQGYSLNQAQNFMSSFSPSQQSDLALESSSNEFALEHILTCVCSDSVTTFSSGEGMLTAVSINSPQPISSECPSKSPIDASAMPAVQSTDVVPQQLVAHCPCAGSSQAQFLNSVTASQKLVAENSSSNQFDTSAMHTPNGMTQSLSYAPQYSPIRAVGATRISASNGLTVPQQQVAQYSSKSQSGTSNMPTLTDIAASQRLLAGSPLNVSINALAPGNTCTQPFGPGPSHPIRFSPLGMSAAAARDFVRSSTEKFEPAKLEIDNNVLWKENRDLRAQVNDLSHSYHTVQRERQEEADRFRSSLSLSQQKRFAKLQEEKASFLFKIRELQKTIQDQAKQLRSCAMQYQSERTRAEKISEAYKKMIKDVNYTSGKNNMPMLPQPSPQNLAAGPISCTQQRGPHQIQQQQQTPQPIIQPICEQQQQQPLHKQQQRAISHKQQVLQYHQPQLLPHHEQPVPVVTATAQYHVGYPTPPAASSDEPIDLTGGEPDANLLPVKPSADAAIVSTNSIVEPTATANSNALPKPRKRSRDGSYYDERIAWLSLPPPAIRAAVGTKARNPEQQAEWELRDGERADKEWRAKISMAVADPKDNHTAEEPARKKVKSNLTTNTNEAHKKTKNPSNLTTTKQVTKKTAKSSTATKTKVVNKSPAKPTATKKTKANKRSLPTKEQVDLQLALLGQTSHSGEESIQTKTEKPAEVSDEEAVDLARLMIEGDKDKHQAGEGGGNRSAGISDEEEAEFARMMEEDDDPQPQCSHLVIVRPAKEESAMPLLIVDDDLFGDDLFGDVVEQSREDESNASTDGEDAGAAREDEFQLLDRGDDDRGINEEE